MLSCTQFDGSDGIQPFNDEGLFILTANHDCGEGTVGGVIAIYNAVTEVGVLIEGQTDGFPSSEEDNEMITALAASLIWQ